jgi:large subunit ribosomal protein L3
MANVHKHRKGSLAFRPRKRAESQKPRIGAWAADATKGLLGFAGYKAGMTHFSYIDDTETPTKGLEVSAAATVVEAPPMYVYGVRAYKRGICIGDVLCDDAKKLEDIGITKHPESSKNKEKLKAENVDDVFVLAFSQPEKTGFGKKSPEPMEIAVGGGDAAEKLEFAFSVLGKEVSATDVFKAGEFVDTISITKGKGWQGAVKRFGVAKQRRKATGRVRHVGTLGPWHPAYVMYTVPMAGQMGYHKRTALNARVMQIGKPEGINPKGGFPHYGVLKNDYILLKGSVGGPPKRLVRLRKAVRKAGMKVATPAIKGVSLVSKQ